MTDYSIGADEAPLADNRAGADERLNPHPICLHYTQLGCMLMSWPRRSRSATSPRRFTARFACGRRRPASRCRTTFSMSSSELQPGPQSPTFFGEHLNGRGARRSRRSWLRCAPDATAAKSRDRRRHVCDRCCPRGATGRHGCVCAFAGGWRPSGSAPDRHRVPSYDPSTGSIAHVFRGPRLADPTGFRRPNDRAVSPCAVGGPYLEPQIQSLGLRRRVRRLERSPRSSSGDVRRAIGKRPSRGRRRGLPGVTQPRCRLSRRALHSIT